MGILNLEFFNKKYIYASWTNFGKNIFYTVGADFSHAYMQAAGKSIIGGGQIFIYSCSA